MSAQSQLTQSMVDESARARKSAPPKSTTADENALVGMPETKDKYILSELTNHARKYSPEAFNSLPPIFSYKFETMLYMSEEGLEQETEFLKVGWNSFRENENTVWALATTDDVKFYRQSSNPKEKLLKRMKNAEGAVNPNQIRLNIPFDYIRNLKEPGGNKIRDQSRKDKRKRRDIFIQFVFMATGRLDAIRNTNKEYSSVLGFFARACEDVMRASRKTVKVNSRKGSEKDPIGGESIDEDKLEDTLGDTLGMEDNGEEQQEGSPNNSKITAGPAPTPVPTKRRGGEKRKRTAEKEDGDQEAGPQTKRSSKQGPENLSVKLHLSTRNSSTNDLLASGMQAIQTAVQDLTTQLDKAKTEKLELRETIQKLESDLAEAQHAANEADDDELADVKLELIEAEQTAKDLRKEKQELESKYEAMKTKYDAIQAVFQTKPAS